MPVDETPIPLDAGALEAARDWFAENFNGLPDTATLAEGIIRAYLSRAARQQDTGAEGWHDVSTAPKDGTHVLVRFDGTMTPPTVAHWFGPPDLPGLRAGGWYLSVQQFEGPQIYPTHWMHVPAPTPPDQERMAKRWRDYY